MEKNGGPRLYISDLHTSDTVWHAHGGHEKGHSLFHTRRWCCMSNPISESMLALCSSFVGEYCSLARDGNAKCQRVRWRIGCSRHAPCTNSLIIPSLQVCWHHLCCREAPNTSTLPLDQNQHCGLEHECH